VLETAGFDVRSALGEDDAITTIQAVQCGTLLMCYSLSKRARKSLAQEFRRYCPKARIIAITNQKLDGPDYADSFVLWSGRPRNSHPDNLEWGIT
jgi:hypothetical protein